MEKEESKVHLTKITMMPGFFAFLLLLSLCGRVCWNFLQKNMLTELIGTLDTRKTTAGRNIIPKVEERNAQVKETYETLMNSLRFYTDYAIYHLGCLLLDFIALLCQAYWVISVIGDADIGFAYNVVKNFFTEYQKWPIQMLYGFPSVAICKYNKIGKVGNPEIRDYICALNWNMPYLKFFSVVWFVQCFCAVFVAFALIYWTLFLTVRSFREYIVRNVLKLHGESAALRGVRRLNGGTLFIIMQLNNNVKTDVVCKILGKVSRESTQNFELFVNGL